MYTGKMLGNIKQFGRCRVKGHGSKCCVSEDIQTTPISKAKEKRIWKTDIKKLGL